MAKFEDWWNENEGATAEEAWNSQQAIIDKYHRFVWEIAHDYIELSQDKIRWQRDDHIKQANKLLKELKGG